MSRRPNSVERSPLPEETPGAFAGQLPPAIEVMIWHYAKGKPKEHVDASVEADLLARLERGRLGNAMGMSE